MGWGVEVVDCLHGVDEAKMDELIYIYLFINDMHHMNILPYIKQKKRNNRSERLQALSLFPFPSLGPLSSDRLYNPKHQPTPNHPIPISTPSPPHTPTAPRRPHPHHQHPHPPPPSPPPTAAPPDKTAPSVPPPPAPRSRRQQRPTAPNPRPPPPRLRSASAAVAVVVVGAAIIARSPPARVSKRRV